MTDRMRTLAGKACGLLATLWIVTSVGAQSPARGGPQTPTFHSQVDVVEVDVVAVDRAGYPVHGLTAADFTLLDRKQPQKIVNFSEVSHEPEGKSTPAATVKRDVASNQTAQAERLVVMVIDDLHLFTGRVAKVQELARAFVDDLGSQATMSVLFTSGEHSIELTEDRAELLNAIATLKGGHATPRPGTQTGPGGFEFFNYLNSFKTLEDAARMLSTGRPRRRAFVWISEGLAKNLQGMFEGKASPCELRTPHSPCPYDEALRDMMTSLQRGNVAIYAIDPRGFVPDERLNTECQGIRPVFPCDPCTGMCPGQYRPKDAWVRVAQRGLEITADTSGGFAITNSDDLAGGVARIIQDLDHYYLLGFTPADPSKGLHELEVITTRPGITLRFRKAYDPTIQPAKTSADPLVALSDGPAPETELPMRFAAFALPPHPASGPSLGLRVVASTDPRVTMALEVSLPARSTATGTPVDSTLNYSVIAVDLKKGKSVQEFTNTATIAARDTGGAGAAGPRLIQVPAEFSLPPGRYQLRASAIDKTSTTGGSVYLAFDVPDLGTGPVALSSLLVGYADRPRVAIGSGPAGTRTDPTRLPFPPSLDRSFTARDTLRVYFEITTRSGGPLSTTVEVVDGSGHAVWSETPRPNATGGIIAYDLPVPLAGRSAGPYLLRVTTRAASGSPVQQDVPFTIRP